MDPIDREIWLTLDADVKGDAYEGLLERNAEDVKSGAGRYFTPGALIGAVVEVMRPDPGLRICDPACGTGGFFLAAYAWMTRTDRAPARLRAEAPPTLRRVPLTNPPFGRKSSITIVNAEGDSERGRIEILRDDFWATTCAPTCTSR